MKRIAGFFFLLMAFVLFASPHREISFENHHGHEGASIEALVFHSADHASDCDEGDHHGCQDCHHCHFPHTALLFASLNFKTFDLGLSHRSLDPSPLLSADLASPFRPPIQA